MADDEAKRRAIIGLPLTGLVAKNSQEPSGNAVATGLVATPATQAASS